MSPSLLCAQEEQSIFQGANSCSCGNTHCQTPLCCCCCFPCPLPFGCHHDCVAAVGWGGHIKQLISAPHLLHNAVIVVGHLLGQSLLEFSQAPDFVKGVATGATTVYYCCCCVSIKTIDNSGTRISGSSYIKGSHHNSWSSIGTGGTRITAITAALAGSKDRSEIIPRQLRSEQHLLQRWHQK